jgi:hypothetical protein
VESGRLAAAALLDSRRTGTTAPFTAYADAMGQKHPHVEPSHFGLSSVVTTLGRQLMRSRFFTRHVVLDRWFLRRDAASGTAAS